MALGILAVLPIPATKGVEVAGWFFDVTTSETRERTYTVTQNPVEGGFKVADHVTRNPDKVTLTGIITATPLLDEDIRVARLEDLLAQLDEIAEARTPLDIFGRVALHKNMVIARIGATMSATTGIALDITLELQQVRVAQLAEIDIPPEFGPNTSSKPPIVKSDALKNAIALGGLGVDVLAVSLDAAAANQARTNLDIIEDPLERESAINAVESRPNANAAILEAATPGFF